MMPFIDEYHLAIGVWLQLFAVAKVTGIPESRYDVLVLVQSRINGSAPDGGFLLGESLLDVFDTFRTGDDACYVNTLGCALGEESLVAQFHRGTGGLLGVGDNQCLTIDAWCSQVFYMNANVVVFLVGVFAVGRNEGVARMVEDIEESVVKGKTGAEDGCQDNLVGRYVDL